jgi:hypothetical protein
MRSLEQIMQGLSAERGKEIDARAAQLVHEEQTLQKPRRARKLTQVSKLEKRADLMISTLAQGKRAMGGNVSLVANFPIGNPFSWRVWGNLSLSQGRRQQAPL